MKKKIAALLLVVCLIFSITGISFADGLNFVTIREWMDAKGECGDCMLVLQIQSIENPVLAIAADETGTVNLFSGNGEDSMIVNFMGDEGLTKGSILVIANPKWNEYEGTVEMADWAVLRMMPALSPVTDETDTEADDTGEEGGGLLNLLFGEGGILTDVISEVTDQNAPEETADEETDQKESETGGILSGLLSTLTGGTDEFSLDALGDLIGQFTGGDDGDWSGIDALFEATSRTDKAEKAYYIERNAELMDIGDVQIVTIINIWAPDNFSGNEAGFQELNKLVQTNYTVDEENQLRLVSGSEDIILLTLQKDEAGDYTVTDAEFADEGNDYMSSVEALCEKVGEPIDDCMDTLDFGEWMVMYEYINYLDANPEIKGIEYAGEIRTSDDLRELQNEFLSEHNDGPEEETDTEEADLIG